MTSSIRVGPKTVKGKPFIVDSNGKPVTVKCVVGFFSGFKEHNLSQSVRFDLVKVHSARDTAQELNILAIQVYECLAYALMYPQVLE